MTKIFAFLKSEPVAVWGVVLAALVGVLTAVGVPAHILEAITAGASLLGIPAVRSQVSPVQAVKAVVNKQAGAVDLVTLGVFLLLLTIAAVVLAHYHLI